MKYKYFKTIELSRLGMGVMRLPILPGHSDAHIDTVKADEIIDYAMKNGINYYDTAYIYHSGKSESYLGQSLVGKYSRESFYLATKFNIMANPDYKAVFEEQLKKLNTDYIDFYLIHAVGDDTFQRYIDCGCIEYLEEQKRLGRIKYFGFSAHASPAVLQKLADYRAWDFAQIQLNYYDWLFGSAKKEYEILAERNIPIVVMESVRGGMLAKLSPEAESILKNRHPDWSIASWAFRWLMRLEQVQLMLSGMSTFEQIENNIGTFSKDNALTDEEEKLLFKACELFQGKIVVPCTGCRYCCDECPAEINIPSVLEEYNKAKTADEDCSAILKQTGAKEKALVCINCQSCEKHCPQNIKISEIMQEIVNI